MHDRFIVRNRLIAIEQLYYIASDFNSLLKYFRGYWETTKKLLSNIYSNKIIPDKHFPDYGTLGLWLHTHIPTFSGLSFQSFQVTGRSFV